MSHACAWQSAMDVRALPITFFSVLLKRSARRLFQVSHPSVGLKSATREIKHSECRPRIPGFYFIASGLCLLIAVSTFSENVWAGDQNWIYTYNNQQYSTLAEAENVMRSRYPASKYLKRGATNTLDSLGKGPGNQIVFRYKVPPYSNPYISGEKKYYPGHYLHGSCGSTWCNSFGEAQEAIHEYWRTIHHACGISPGGSTLQYTTWEIGGFSLPDPYDLLLRDVYDYEASRNKIVGGVCDPLTEQKDHSLITSATPYKCPDGYRGVKENGVGVCIADLSDHITGTNIQQCDDKNGNPCSPATGNKSETEIDYKSGLLAFVRYYNSAQQTHPSVVMAPGWQHSYSQYLALDSSAQPSFAVREDGSFMALNYNAADDAYYPAGGKSLLIEPDGSGWILEDSRHFREYYDSAGRLQRVEDSSGMQFSLTYNENEKLSHVTDPAGRRLTFAYDISTAKLNAVTDPSGGVITFSYDGLGRLTRVVYQDNSSRRYHYENPLLPNHLTGITDENGNRFSTFDYDVTGRAVSTEHAGGAEKVEFVYNTDGTTTVNEASGNRYTYTFTIAGGKRIATRVTGGPCVSCTAKFSEAGYDANGFPSHIKDYNGNTTKFIYDVMGREISRTEAFGTPQERTITTSWIANKQLVEKITELSKTTSYIYDSRGLLTQKTVTDTAVGSRRAWNYTYSALGQMNTADGPRTDVADVTTYAYDAKGNITAITNALGQITQITAYDAHGHPLTLRDPNGLVTQLTYDPRGRLTSRTVGSETTTYQYDGVGQLIQVKFPDASFVDYRYDAAHRLIGIADSVGNSISYTLDLMGNRVKEEVRDQSGALARTRSRVFDALNRLAQDLGAQGQIASFQYDNNGNLTASTNPLGHATTQTYDALNRLMQSTDPAGGVTRYGHDTGDRITQITDPRGVATAYEHDGFDQLRRETSADRGVLTYNYDVAGNLATQTDARGMTTSYTYDAINRLAQVNYANGTRAVYVYDAGPNALGRLTKITDTSGSVEFGYDVAGRLVKKIQKVGSRTFTTGYRYDAFGRLATMTYPSGLAVGYGYGAGRITSITVNGNPLFSTIVYDPFGEVKSGIFGNNATFARSFDLDGRLTSQSLGSGARAYTYDAASRIKSFIDPVHNLTLNYDVLDRLTQSSGSFSRTFAYDAVGNRTLDRKGATTTQYITESSSNRLLSTTTGTLTKTKRYDPAGNMLNDGTYRHVYDARGRMIETRNASNALVGIYTINELGQRVKKIRGTATTYFVYDEAGHLIGEYNGSGTAVQETIYLGDMPVGILKANTRYYIQPDHLNTPRTILDQANRVIWLWRADPFGTTNPNTDPDGDGTAFAYNLRFPGQYFDQETGLFYNYFRDYDPRTGRYVQSDPIGLEAGLNTYAYVSGNPISLADPLGLSSKVKKAKPYGNSYDRRQWDRHGPKPIKDPNSDNKDAWEKAAEMLVPDLGFVCVEWDCPQSPWACTKGDQKRPFDFIPVATSKENAPAGCNCSSSKLRVDSFKSPSADADDWAELLQKLRNRGIRR